MATNNAINAPLPLLPANGGSGLSNPTAHGILVSEGSGNFNPIVLPAGEVLIGTTAGDPVAAALIAGTGVSITSVSGSITIASTGANPWADETGSSVTMTANTGYTADDGSSLVTFTLPATSDIGDWVEINGKSSGGWKIAQALGQQINFGASSTTSGTTGYLASTNQYDCVRLRCITSNTTWVVTSAQGNLTVN